MLIEMINKALGLTSKDAKKKAADNAANDVLLTALFKLQATIKDGLVKSQSAARQGVELFKSQFQKQLVKQVTENSEYVLEYFATKVKRISMAPRNLIGCLTNFYNIRRVNRNCLILSRK